MEILSHRQILKILLCVGAGLLTALVLLGSYFLCTIEYGQSNSTLQKQENEAYVLTEEEIKKQLDMLKSSESSIASPTQEEIDTQLDAIKVSNKPPTPEEIKAQLNALRKQ